MTEPRPRPDAPLDPEMVETIEALQGDESFEDQDAALEPDQIESRREPTRTDIDRGAPAVEHDEITDLDGLAIDGLREGETDDARVATEEGLTWVPPTDPRPVDDDDDIAPDLADAIADAVAGDARTATIDGIEVVVDGGRVTIHGEVKTLEDADMLVAVIGEVSGVTGVVDETELASR